MKDILCLNKQKGAKVWLWFFIAAVASLLFALIPFMVRGNHLIWATLEQDGAVQGVTYLNYVREVGWFKAVGSYDYFIGLGADFLTSLSFFSLFDPFVVFVFLLPFDIVWVYDIIMFLKFIAAGAACLAYLRHRRVEGGFAVTLSLLYMFCGFIAFTFVRHLNLTSGPIWLPLMAMGVEKVYRKENPFVLILSVFFCLINSFYMFFFNSVFAVLYAFFYHGEASRGEGNAYWRTLIPRCWKIAALYLLGVLLAGFMLLPNAYAYLHAARSASKGFSAFTFEYFATGLWTLFFPVTAPHYSAIGMNFFVLALLVFAVLSCRKKGFALRLCVIVFAVGFYSLVFGYMMNIFNYPNNRWSYILSFCAVALIGVNTTERNALAPYPKKQVKIFFKTISLLFALAVIFTLCWAVKLLVGSSLSRPAAISLAVLCGLIALAFAGTAAWLLSRRSPFEDKTAKSGELRSPVLDTKITAKVMSPAAVWRCALACTVLFAFVFYCIYSAQFPGGAVYRSLSTPEERYVSQLNEEEFFRTDTAAAESWWDCFRNYGVNSSYMGTRMYNSMSSDEVYTFLKENAVYNPTQNLGISGLDNRAALQSLLSVKYYVGPELYGNSGFTNVQGYEDLYENQYYVPFGFAYKDTVSRACYDGLDPVLRQYAMLGAMVVESEGTLGAADVAALQPLLFESSKPVAEGVTVGTGETVTLTVRGCAGKEVYLRLYGAAVTENRVEFRVAGNGKTRTYMYAQKGDLMYSEQRDPCFCLGIPDGDEMKIEISHVSGDALQLNSVAVQGYDIAAYESAVRALQSRPHLENVEFGSNNVGGNISLAEESWVFFSLPYSEGWSAAVDGAPAEIVRANSAFMAVRVGAGEHSVELTYATPYLKEGGIVSVAALAAFAGFTAVWAVLYFRKRGAAETAPNGENGSDGGDKNGDSGAENGGEN